MAWDTEDTIVPDHDSPMALTQCEPCIALFNPIVVTGTTVIIDADSHLNHYIVESENDVTVILMPCIKDSVTLLGMVCLITRNTVFNVYVNDSSVSPTIFRGLKQIDAKGDSIGLISVEAAKYVLAGATRLV